MEEGRVTGIVRAIDGLGRIVLPTEYRNVLNLHPHDKLEYFGDDKRKAIMVYRYQTKECLFCSSEKKTIYFKKFYICMSCIQSLPELQIFFERVERQRGDEKHVTGTKKKRITKRRKEALDRLHQVMKENPGASQKEIAEILGVSQSWISQIIRNRL